MEGLAVGKEKESDSWRGIFPLSLPFGFLFTSTSPSMNQISNIAINSLSPMWLRLGLGQWFSFVSTFYKAYAYLFFWSLWNVLSFKSPCHLQHKPMVNHVNIVHHVNGKENLKSVLNCWDVNDTYIFLTCCEKKVGQIISSLLNGKNCENYYFRIEHYSACDKNVDQINFPNLQIPCDQKHCR